MTTQHDPNPEVLTETPEVAVETLDPQAALKAFMAAPSPEAVEEPEAPVADAAVPDFDVQEVPEEPAVGLAAGSLPSGVVKVPVKTSIGNLATYSQSAPALRVVNMTDGSATGSFAPSTGTAIVTLDGDLTIGKSPTLQQRKGYQLNTALNDDNQNLAVLGREWREIQLLNHTIVPTDSLTLVPARDTHRIFIFKDNNSAICRVRLTATGLVPGMKFMFTNLSAAETTGTNEQQTITIDATGGTFTITFGGQTTTALAYNASAATVQTALEALSSIGTGNITVGLVGLVYTLTFKNDLGRQNVAQVTTNAASLTGGAGTATVATSVAGVAATGKLDIVSDGAGILNASTVNRLVLSAGALVILTAVPSGLVSTIGANFIMTHSRGTVTVLT